jgi:hypothetical protein
MWKRVRNWIFIERLNTPSLCSVSLSVFPKTYYPAWIKTGFLWTLRPMSIAQGLDDTCARCWLSRTWLSNFIYSSTIAYLSVSLSRFHTTDGLKCIIRYLPLTPTSVCTVHALKYLLRCDKLFSGINLIYRRFGLTNCLHIHDRKRRFYTPVMETVGSYKPSVHFYRIIRCNNPEDGDHHSRRPQSPCNNLLNLIM